MTLDNPELRELAQLEWDLRSPFDTADAVAMTASLAASDKAGAWMSRPHALHPSWLVHIWHAIHKDEAAPEVVLTAQAISLSVWRKGLQSRFQTLDEQQLACLAFLDQGHSVLSDCDQLALQDKLPEQAILAQWFATWLDDAILCGDPA